VSGETQYEPTEIPSLLRDLEEDLRPLPHEQRYAQRTVLGRGGMGEVFSCTDVQIGREVALKLVRRDPFSTGELEARFLREARVQGQLEHPSIVPVYELGRDGQGQLFFTMKRVRGETLEQALEGLRRGDPRAERIHTRQKLLGVFMHVCLGLEYAHARGVVHRDIKPSNIMLGDFGEVHILDWGVAKLNESPSSDPYLSAGNLPGEPMPVMPALTLDTVIKTAEGSVMGTPQYMAPEQILPRGRPVDPRIDVYALGAILFEILSLQPLHGEGSASTVMERVVRGVERRLSVRAPELLIPEELENICSKACSLNPRDRHNSARALHDEIETFLSGDRDNQKRRERAVAHIEIARALANDNTAEDIRATTMGNTHARALREIGRALALDPGNRDGLLLLVRLLTSPPKALPKEVRLEIKQGAERSRRTVQLRSMIVQASTTLFFFVPMAAWMGVKDAPYAFVCLLVLAAAGLVGIAAYAFPKLSDRAPWFALASLLAACVCSLAMGPFLILPSMILSIAVLGILAGQRAHRIMVLAAGTFAGLLPWVLEFAGVVAPSFRFEGGAIILTSKVLTFTGLPTLLLLGIANSGLVTFTALSAYHFRQTVADTEAKSALVSWQLGQLVPDAARAVAKSGPASRRAKNNAI
jgi:eukaryotic-like serine/threonine-protein kinase